MTDPALLSLPPEEIRRLGYRIVDALVEQSRLPREEVPAPRVSMADFMARVAEPPPAAASDADAVLDLAFDAVRGHMNHTDHPRYFSRVPGPGSPAGALGDMLATAFNAGAMSETGHAGPTALELVTLRWLAELLGMPAETEGVLLSGGSMSSLTAFATARHTMLGGPDPDAVVYLSDQAHSSMARGLRIIGFSDDRVRILASDERLTLSVLALAEAVAADRAAGLRPFMVVATAGTTNAGAVDPMHPIADLAEAEALWMHVDGAYGAPAALTETGRELLDGIQRADSLTLDPHKWLFAPYEIGVLLVRRPGALEQTFTVNPEYLRDSGAGIHLRNRGPQLTRATRAVKLWMIFKLYGVDALRAAIARGIELAEIAESELRADPDWEIVSGAQLAVVNVAHRRLDAEQVTARVLADGYSALGTTELRGRQVVRLCTINPRTTDEEMRQVVRRMTELARQPSPAPARAGR
jgi:glutamate/tyrosine decarboxylase-like PLP-dependent enzyme